MRRTRILPACAVQAAALLLAGLLLMGCAAQAAVPPTEAPTLPATETALPTATELPSATPTTPPTATDLPTATTIPTNTAVPPLDVVEDGINVWCTPIDSGAAKPTAPDEPVYARKMIRSADGLIASIPATYCTVSYRFNQPLPEGVTLRVLEGKSAFIQQPLVAAASDPQLGWTTLEHAYIVNPPFWEVTYQLSVVAADGKELWSEPVKFAKPIPEECPFGGLPDPVTLYCGITDPWEIEPWPDVTYPYDRSRLTPNP